MNDDVFSLAVDLDSDVVVGRDGGEGHNLEIGGVVGVTISGQLRSHGYSSEEHGNLDIGYVRLGEDLLLVVEAGGLASEVPAVIAENFVQ